MPLQMQAGEGAGLVSAISVGHLGWIRIDLTPAGTKTDEQELWAHTVRRPGRRNSL